MELRSRHLNPNEVTPKTIILSIPPTLPYDIKGPPLSPLSNSTLN